MLKAIALDFDGVILESVDIKTRAFSELFKDYPQHLEGIIRLHIDNGGISRHEKFRTIYREYLKRPLSHDEAERLGNEFSRFVMKEILSCPFVPGALEFLAQTAMRLPLFIVSGSPETELREIVRHRLLESYFRAVYGSPASKSGVLQAILSENNWNPSEMVFVGDSLSDFEAAELVGVRFIGRIREGAANPFTDSIPCVVGGLKELAKRCAEVGR